MSYNQNFLHVGVTAKGPGPGGFSQTQNIFN